ncbi:MAG: hypothetical protein U0L59_07645 [Faecalimonas sp.]|nr:hypothetical protein [Faecalimonas sp.]
MGATESLDCTKFEDRFKFSSLENSENAIYIGIQGGGVRIIPQPDDSLQIYFRVRAPHNIAQKMGDITAEEAGITSFKETWNRIGLSFVFSNTSQTTTDVEITVNVNDYKESYHLTGLPLETLTRYVTLQGTSLSPLYHGEEEDAGPAPIMNESFTKLTFDSYGIKTGVYKYNDNRLSASGSCEKGDLDRVIFSDTVNFSDASGARILVGGGQSAWHGLAIYNIAEDTIQIKSAAGQPFEPLVLRSKEAGVKLTGQDVKLTMSFEYVDSDEDGKKDDVKFAIWFDGKAYQNRYFYLTDMVPNLGGYMGIYVDNKEASLAIKTYVEPADFTEYGFTTNWKKELRLNDK